MPTFLRIFSFVWIVSRFDWCFLRPRCLTILSVACIPLLLTNTSTHRCVRRAYSANRRAGNHRYPSKQLKVPKWQEPTCALAKMRSMSSKANVHFTSTLTRGVGLLLASNAMEWCVYQPWCAKCVFKNVQVDARMISFV